MRAPFNLELQMMRGNTAFSFFITNLGIDRPVHSQNNLVRRKARRRIDCAPQFAIDNIADAFQYAAHQSLRHPACDFARHVMQVALAGTEVTLSDGATNVLPVPRHVAAAGAISSEAEREDNRRAIHAAWRAHYDDVRHSLRHAYYQGWDMHPGQLPKRYAAVAAFFLEARDEAAARLHTFVEKAAQATLLGNVFDDAATGQALLNFFLRGLNCGALTEQDALATGLTLEELRGRSFAGILAARRQPAG